MARVLVSPAADGTDIRSNWEVLKPGSKTTSHTKKSAAKRRAKRIASSGDTLEIRRTDGTIQERRVVQ